METPSKLFSVSDAVGISGGRLINKNTESEIIYSVVIDSRKVLPGSLFVALKGERTDGHVYIENVIENGAVCVLVSDEFSESTVFTDRYSNVAFITVKNPLKSLQKLAEHYAMRFPDLIRIGVTGSSGKTTTKEIIKSIFSVSNATVANEGNLNSEIGLPLSMFLIRPEHKYGIFEMGINFTGEMELLTRVYKPQFAVVTNIGTAHIGPLGGVDGIIREKARIFSCFAGNSRAFLPSAGPHLPELKSACKDMYVLFGRDQISDLDDIENLGIDGWKFRYKRLQIAFSLPGKYNLDNVFAAISVAEFFDIRPEDIKKGIESVVALSGRSQVIKGNVTIIEDSYNANADSVEKVLNYFDRLSWNGRKIIVFGSMKELGSDTEKFHREIGVNISSTRVGAVFLYGAETESTYEMVKSSNPGLNCFHSIHFEELKSRILEYVAAGDLVLLKGSRSMELERLVEPLQIQEAYRNV